MAEADADGRLISIEEKPSRLKSNLAVTGLTAMTTMSSTSLKQLQPSARGELEITDLNNVYVERGTARLIDLGRGTAWLDTGTHDSLVEAGQFVQVLNIGRVFASPVSRRSRSGRGYIDGLKPGGWVRSSPNRATASTSSRSPTRSADSARP